MDNVRVVKASYDVNDCVHFADMRQKFIAQALARGRALYKPRDVNEFQHRRRDLFGIVHFSQNVQPLVGNGVRFDRAERVIRALRARFRDRVEKRAFSYVRKPYNSEFHSLTSLSRRLFGKSGKTAYCYV